MNCLQLSLVNGDVRRAIIFLECMVVDDFGLLQADLKSKELGSFCKAGRQTLQGPFSVGDECSIVGKEEVTDQLLKSLCVGLQPPEVE